MRALGLIVLLLAFATTADAQIRTQMGGTGCLGAPLTVATLPASPTVGQVCTVSDALTQSNCSSGSGTYTAQCLWNGTIWQPIATKEYVDLAVSNRVISEHFTNTASSIGGIYYLMDTPTVAAATVTSGNITTDPENLFNFATAVNKPGLDTLPAGTYTVRFNGYKTGAGTRTFRPYFELYKRIEAGTETLLATSEYGALTVASPGAIFDLHATLSTTQTLLTTDRIIVKMYVDTVSAGGGTNQFVVDVGGTYDSRLVLQVQPSDLGTVYVPYTGAVSNVDLGSLSLAATTYTGGIAATSTAATAAANDNDTSLATTAFVQQEFNANDGRSITNADATGTLDADPELYTDAGCAVIMSPTATTYHGMWKAPVAVTIAEQWAETQGTSVAFHWVNAGTNVDADFTASTGNADASLNGDTTVAADGVLDLVLTTVTGTTSQAAFCLKYTKDD